MTLANRAAALSRRDFLRLSAAGVSATSMTGWLPRLAARAAEEGAKHKACIVLWMDGGPPHKDTFDMKPGTPDAGVYKPIQTSVPGIEISELFPNFAKLIQHATIIRSMSTPEVEHLRARMHLRTGYRDGQAGLTYPSIGSIASMELGMPDFPIPNYVAIADRKDRSHGPGFLGSAYQPLYVHDPKRGVENLKAAVDASQLGNRMGLLDELEESFSRSYQSSISQDHKHVYQKAVQLMKTDKAKAFDLSLEPAAGRGAYGESKFGQGCLLARRLIETGVKLVEVSNEGWDTHFENNDTVKKLSGAVDPAMSTLVADLKERGLLDSTLVIWMGEFGRTPKFKGKGRDHYGKAWSTMLIGGGIKTGQVVGKTDKDGATVEQRPVSVPDFMATVCTILGIRPNKMNTTPGRRTPIVEKGFNLLTEVL